MPKTPVLPAESHEALERALEILRQGGLVCFPTDTVYGVGAHGFQEEAIRRIYQAKERPLEKAIALLLASEEQVEQVSAGLTPAGRRLAERYWPGALTLVLPRRPEVPAVLSPGRATVAVRIPDHPLTLHLIRMLGAPLAATSANRSGHPDPVTAEDVVRELGDRVDLILDGGRCPGGVPSTVVDLTTDPPAILRAGPIPEEELAKVLGAKQAPKV